MVQESADLLATCHSTSGPIPAKRMGASTTVVGDKLYLFGGRLLLGQRVVSDLYAFDFQTYRWEKIPPHPDDDVPEPRYFHSAVTWNDLLVIFGGRCHVAETSSISSSSTSQKDVGLFDDLRYFDLQTRRWVPRNAELPNRPSTSFVPRARYAHLASVSGDRLFIIGGQDINDEYIPEVNVYDLVAQSWENAREVPLECGTYRSTAVSSSVAVHLPGQSLSPVDSSENLTPAQEQHPQNRSFIHLPYTAQISEQKPGDVFIYSNHNFNNVKRGFHVVSTTIGGDLTLEDRTDTFSSSSSRPPGLRFPNATILGSSLVVSGTQLEGSRHSYSIWSLNLLSSTWSHIDVGRILTSGSWSQSCLYVAKNKLYVFGNRNGNFIEDYSLRLSSWDHVVVVDLETFGIYQPPELLLDLHMQELGLAALKGQFFTDFDLICEDGRRISCSRKLLEDRWPWLKDRFRLMRRSPHRRSVSLDDDQDRDDVVVDPRLTSNSFDLGQPYAMTLALLQYFYSLSLVTPLQHAPLVLNGLLILGTEYEISHLVSLVKHAMHQVLSPETAAGICEVSAICQCQSLHVRALKLFMSTAPRTPSHDDSSSLDLSASGQRWVHKEDGTESYTDSYVGSASVVSTTADYSFVSSVNGSATSPGSQETIPSKTSSAKRRFTLKLPTPAAVIFLPSMNRDSPAARIAKAEQRKQKKEETKAKIDTLAKTLGENKPAKPVVRLDSCHAGTWNRGGRNANRPVPAMFGGLVM